MKRRALVLVVAAAALACTAAPAMAHAPIEGIGAFYNGMLHPVFVPAHLLLLLGLGLLLGQHAPSLSRHGWIAFVAAFWAGLAAGHAIGVAVPQAALLVLALIAGLMVALAKPFGAIPMAVLAGTAGLGIGFDSPAEGTAGGEAWLTLCGTAIGGVLVVSYAGGVVAALGRSWQRVGVRVAGSWMAASAAIVLALLVTGPARTG